MSAKEALLAPQEALWDYLDTLLREIPPDILPADNIGEIQDWDPAALQVVESPSAAEPLPPALVQPIVESPPIVASAAAPRQREHPDWAQADFQALLFIVGRLTLAVPLVTLHGVLPWPEQGVTPMPNQPAWCLGLTRHRDRNVRVVDTGTMVIPPDREELRPAEAPQHLLIVGDGGWALACNEIGSVVRLTPDKVRWRSGKGQRPWLAGTVLEHLCALMDTEAFADMLAEKL